MNNKTRTLTLFASVLFLATPALAQSTAMINRMIDTRFAAADTNKDGRLPTTHFRSFEWIGWEIKAVGPLEPQIQPFKPVLEAPENSRSTQECCGGIALG